MLDIAGVTKRFGGLVAVDEVTFHVAKGTIVGVIGPNGSGKTTLFNVITGVLKPEAGRISFLEKDITGLPPYEIVRTGVARTFQNIRLFGSLTVEQNVVVGQHCRVAESFGEAIFSPGSVTAKMQKAGVVAAEVLEFVSLSGASQMQAKNLPYGDQRRLEIARALATEPKVLLLDEPAAGMNPNEAQRLMDLIRRISAKGITVLVVDHMMRMVMNVCERLVVLDHGKMIAEGAPVDIQKDERVIEAYLGKAVRRRRARGA